MITIGLSPASPRECKKKHHPYQEWFKMLHNIRETDIRWKTRTKATSDFLRRVMPPPLSLNQSHTEDS